MFAIAAELARRGHEIRLYCYSWEAPAPPHWLQLHLLKARGFTNHGRAAAFSRELHEVLRREKADLTVAFDLIPGADVFFAANNCFAVAAEKKWGLLRKLIPRCRIFEAHERALLTPQSRTRILYLAPRQREDFQRIYHTPPERFYLLPPGIAADRRPPSDPGEARRNIRRELGVADDDFLLFQAAAAFHTKGVDRSISALAALPEPLRSRSVLAVAGNGDNGCRRLADSCGIAGQCRFLGSRSDIPSLAAAADLMIHPARNEAAGTVLIESLAAGNPVMASACCGFAGHVSESGGWVIPEPFQQKTLDRMLQELLSHPEALAAARRDAAAYAKTHDFFHRAECAADILEKIREGSEK